VIENRENTDTTNQSVCVTAPTHSTLVVELLERETPTSKTGNPTASQSSTPRGRKAEKECFVKSQYGFGTYRSAPAFELYLFLF